MSDIRSKISEIYSLEQLSCRNTWVHHIHPLAKLVGTICFLICIMSVNRYDWNRMIPFFFYPFLLMAFAEIPFSMIGKRVLIALPFCLFAGLSNLILDRQVLFVLGRVPVTTGLASLFTILIKTFLCVSAVLVLIASTRFTDLTLSLRWMHFPTLLLALIEMTYRYIGCLLEEATNMYTAYRLRSTKKKGLELKHMGSFVGQLLIRSFGRAERIYQAMKCRGYGSDAAFIRKNRQSFGWKDGLYLLIICGFCIICRLIPVTSLIGGLLI